MLMIKILHIITRLDMGGSAQNTIITCQELAAKYDIILAHGLSLESKMTDLEQQSVDRQIEKAKECGVRVIPIASLVRKIDPVNDIKAFLSILLLIIREKPFFIHTHSSKAGILGRLAAKICCVPIIIHTPHGHVFFGHFGPFVSKVYLLIEKFFTLFTDRLVALTEGERKDYIELSVAKPEKIVTIHSGVEIDLFKDSHVNIEKKKKLLGLNLQSLVVGTVGWLLPIKGPMILLKAMGRVWQKYPDAQLVYVGKGDLYEALHGQALQMGIADRVKLMGWRDDIHEIMSVFDLFVLPSLNEGMGRVLVEAMAAGKPVVASNVGGIPDLVKDGKNGLLVEPGDTDGLSFAIQELLSDKKIRDEMGEKGKNMAQSFSVEKMIEKINDLYYMLIQELK
jgi:glycosyltransferase involved in cell wall biosynthesis